METSWAFSCKLMEDKRSYDSNYVNSFRILACHCTCCENNCKSKRQTKELEMSLFKNTPVIDIKGFHLFDHHGDNSNLYF